MSAHQRKDTMQIRCLRTDRMFQRPGGVVPIEPDGLHAHGASCHDIQCGVVAHMQHFVGCAPQMIAGSQKYRRIRFGHTELAGAEARLEMMPERDAFQIRIAIGDGHQWQAGGDFRKHCGYFRKGFDLLPRGPAGFVKEDGEVVG